MYWPQSSGEIGFLRASKNKGPTCETSHAKRIEPIDFWPEYANKPNKIAHIGAIAGKFPIAGKFLGHCMTKWAFV